MTKKLDTTFIQIVHPVCCGLDVHKKKISACLITMDEQGKEQYAIKEFGTFTNELIEMREWLTDNNCPILAMESTGVYWRPVHNVLEGFMEVTLVNARHIKNVPGRKTDISDCKWLAGGVDQPCCSNHAAIAVSVRWFQKSSHQSLALKTRKDNIGFIELVFQLAPGIFNLF